MNRTPRGCSNIGGAAAAKIEFCRNRAMQLFSLYGYRPFSPAGLQLMEDVWNNLSPARSKRLIALTSPYGEPCVLRGDLTLLAVSYLGSHFTGNERPLRLSYADRVFSMPQPPRSNLEENQVGVEIIGWEGEGADAEVVSLLLRTLDALSIESSAVVVGDMAVMWKFFEGLPEELCQRLVTGLQDGRVSDYMEEIASAEMPEKRRALLRALPTLKGGMGVLDEAAQMLDNPAALRSLKNLCATLEKLGYAERLRVDLGFVRDLGYYSGPIFNVYSTATGSLLGGGGRYDGLLAKVGLDGEAAGFALNLKELADHSAMGTPTPKIMIWCGASDPAEGLRYTDVLSRRGVPFELSWNADGAESLRVAKLRGYAWWVDYTSKKAFLVETGEQKELAEMERGTLSC